MTIEPLHIASFIATSKKTRKDINVWLSKINAKYGSDAFTLDTDNGTQIWARSIGEGLLSALEARRGSVVYSKSDASTYRSKYGWDRTLTSNSSVAALMGIWEPNVYKAIALFIAEFLKPYVDTVEVVGDRVAFTVLGVAFTIEHEMWQGRVIHRYKHGASRELFLHMRHGVFDIGSPTLVIHKSMPLEAVMTDIFSHEAGSTDRSYQLKILLMNIPGAIAASHLRRYLPRVTALNNTVSIGRRGVAHPSRHHSCYGDYVTIVIDTHTYGQHTSAGLRAAPFIDEFLRSRFDIVDHPFMKLLETLN